MEKELKSETINIRITPTILTALRRIAADDMRTVSEQMAWLIRQEQERRKSSKRQG